MQKSIRIAVVATGLLAIAACTTIGTGVGVSRRGEVRANFSWTAQSATQGQMSATMEDGRVYQGQFFQITRETSVDELQPLWVGWRGRNRWRGWDNWGPRDATVTQYTGNVLANLRGPDGFMRCRFHLIQPSSGMQQGGEGLCQMPGGGRIHAQFDRGH